MGRHIMYCVQRLNLKETHFFCKKRENVLNWKFNVFDVGCGIYSLMRKDFFIFSLALLCTHENVIKNLSHSLNKFHIQRQTIEYTLYKCTMYIFYVYFHRMKMLKRRKDEELETYCTAITRSSVFYVNDFRYWQTATKILSIYPRNTWRQENLKSSKFWQLPVWPEVTDIHINNNI